VPVSLGQRRPTSDLRDLLLDCHDRIRSFTAMAQRLARGDPAAAPEEVADAAGQVRRYFAVALPLHARDEEESILPRLRGLDPEVDRELDAMHAEHAGHEPLLARLVALCDALAAEPSRRAELGPALGQVADELAGHFAEHLGREERAVFPALGRLSDGERAQIVAELRARRGGSADAPARAVEVDSGALRR
jgi:hypothetical protein